MKVSDAIANRKSVRAFLNKPVTKEQIETILDKARRSPSGGNTQPWHCYVVTGDARQDITDGVSKLFEQGIFEQEKEYSTYPEPDVSKEYMERRRKLGFDMFSLLGIARDDQEGRMNAMRRNFNFFDAPVAIFLTIDRFTDRNAWGHAGLFLGNITLLAEEMGLSTCLQEAWNAFPQLVYEKLKIPTDKEIFWCAISIGYADRSAKVNELVSERIPVSSFAKFSGFEKETHSKI